MPLQRSAHTGALTDSSYVQLVGGGVAAIDLGFPMRYSHSSLEVCDLGDLDQLTTLLVEGIAAIDAGFSLDRDDYRMSYYLGIDIGTFESKGVHRRRQGPDRRQRVEAAQDAGAAAGLGRASAEAGLVGRLLLHLQEIACRESKHRPEAIRAVGTSAIGPCMLPVDADGEALSNAALYGVDARAAKEIDELNAAIGAERILDALRQCADLAIGRPENPVAEEEPAGDLRQGRQDRHLDHLSRAEADRRMRHRSLFGGEFLAALCYRQAGLEHGACAGHHRARPPAEAVVDDRYRRPRDRRRRRARPGLPPARR